MELKEINIAANMIPLVLKIISQHEFKGKEFHFVYGQEEYTKDFKKVKKQLKRALRL
jgi:translation initiation factor 1 (eIF-1/SUI1)